VSVLQQIADSLKTRLDPDARAELAASIAAYRRGRVPRTLPVTLLRDHAHRLAIGALCEQSYLNPRPGELMLRGPV
jgi:uncharacterized protein YbgA (DUF1722 family)